MDYPLISVLLPVYNAEKYIAVAIQSILDQSYNNFELLIFDDASTDDSKEIIKSFKDKRITLYESEINRGHLEHLNEGIKRSKGEFIARMDADDISHPNRFNLQIQEFIKNDELGVCGTNFQTFGEYEQNIIHPETHKGIKSLLLDYCCIAHPSVMIRKSVLEKYKTVYDEKYYTAEDYELWTRLIFSTKFMNIQQFLLKYRIQERQMSQANSELQNTLSHKILLRYFDKICLDLIGCSSNLNDFGADFFVFLQENEKKIIAGNYDKKIIHNNGLIMSLNMYYDLCIVNTISYNPIILCKSIKSLYFKNLNFINQIKFITKNLIFYDRIKYYFSKIS